MSAVEVKCIGSVKITSGRLATGDPLCNPDNVFVQHVPIGNHRVLIYLDGHDIAAATIIVQEGVPVMRWEEAKFEDGGGFEYGVDAGVGTFVDATVAYTLEHNDEMSEFIIERMGERQQTHDWKIDESHNAIIFQTGAGDGKYPNYVGYDADGNPTLFLTDFYILDTDWRIKYLSGIPLPDYCYEEDEDYEDGNEVED